MNNPYLSTDNCVTRLYNEYKKHRKLLIAVDFDDTVFDYHNKGYEYSETIEVLKRCSKHEFYIVIFTGADPSKWKFQKEYLESCGISTVATINRNPIDLPFGNWGKIYYNILLDDRSGLGQSIKILNTAIDKIEKEKENAN